jgi:hypothetical protein
VADLSLTRNRPREVEHQKLVEEVVRLRMEGMSYREIGRQVSRSHVRCREIVHEAMREVAEESFENAGVLLGQELERVDGLIRKAGAILRDPRSTAAEKLRAIRALRGGGAAWCLHTPCQTPAGHGERGPWLTTASVKARRSAAGTVRVQPPSHGGCPATHARPKRPSEAPRSDRDRRWRPVLTPW